jgi:hypothetical protein
MMSVKSGTKLCVSYQDYKEVEKHVWSQVDDLVKHKVAEDIHNKRRIMVRLESGLI